MKERSTPLPFHLQIEVFLSLSSHSLTWQLFKQFKCLYEPSQYLARPLLFQEINKITFLPVYSLSSMCNENINTFRFPFEPDIATAWQLTHLTLRIGFILAGGSLLKARNLTIVELVATSEPSPWPQLRVCSECKLKLFRSSAFIWRLGTSLPTCCFPALVPSILWIASRLLCQCQIPALVLLSEHVQKGIAFAEVFVDPSSHWLQWVLGISQDI